MFNNLKILGTLGLFCFFAFLPKSFGADFHSPRTDALGGAGHASPLLTDSIYLNPSFASYVSSHALSFDYLAFGGGSINGPGGMSDYYGHNMNLSVLDGTAESLFQAGVGFTRRDDANLIHIGASKSVVDRLGIGIGSKFIFPNDNSGSRAIDLTFSMTGLASSWFQAAFIVDNLLENATSRGFYREYILGTKFNVDSIFLIYLDPNWTPSIPGVTNPWGYQAGVEFPFFQEVFFRVGGYSNSTIPFQAIRGSGWGLGLGWMGPKISLDYAFSRVTTGISSLAHNFQATIFF